MKIIVTDPNYKDVTYEGEDLYPLVDEDSQRLDIVDHAGRPLGIFPRGNWYSVNIEHDEDEEPEYDGEAADSVGTAYIDIKPRFGFTEDDVSKILAAIGAGTLIRP